MIRVWGCLSTYLIVGLVLFIGVDLIARGAGGFSTAYFLGAPTNLGRSGGIGPVLVSTGVIVLASLALATVFSFATAITYVEMIGPIWFRRLVSAVLDIGVGMPRIVWGLFGAAVFGGFFGFGFSIISGVATLACLLAPILATGFIAGLEEVDPRLREQCASLGVSRWTTLWLQVMPAARPALTASLALALARGCGDAAALLFTAGLSTELPGSLFDSASTLAVFIFNLMTSVPGGQIAAYTAAAVLFLITFALQLIVASTQSKQGFAR